MANSFGLSLRIQSWNARRQCSPTQQGVGTMRLFALKDRRCI